MNKYKFCKIVCYFLVFQILFFDKINTKYHTNHYIISIINFFFLLVQHQHLRLLAYNNINIGNI